MQRMTTGNSFRSDFNLVNVTGPVVGRSYDLSPSIKNRTLNAWAGTALAWRTCDETTGNGTQVFGIPHGGNKSPQTKHIVNAVVNTQGMQGVLTLVDLQGYWPGISMNSAATQNLTGTPSLRYTNGEGCKLYFVVTTASGATAHTLSLSYTNSSGTSGRSLARAHNCLASAPVQTIPYTAVDLAAPANPYLILADGDIGVSNVASVTFSAASGSGAGALCLARPLLSVILSNITTEKDLINDLPALPQVKDGACLVWLLTSFSTVSSGHGYIDFAWAP